MGTTQPPTTNNLHLQNPSKKGGHDGNNARISQNAHPDLTLGRRGTDSLGQQSCSRRLSTTALPCKQNNCQEISPTVETQQMDGWTVWRGQLGSPWPSPDVSHLQMHRTNLLFGMPDQGQMLDVWESQTAGSALRCTCHPTWRGHHLSLGSISWISQDIPVGICADILYHTYWNQGKIQFKDCSIRRTSYSTWLHSELVRYATSVLWA